MAWFDPIVIVSLFYSYITFLGWRMVGHMSRMTLRQVADADAQESYQRVKPLFPEEWLEANQFHRSGVYDVGHPRVKVYLATWQHGAEPTYLYGYLVRGKTGKIEIFTLYDGSFRLGTSNLRATHAWPAVSTAWCQSFSTRSIDQLWTQHEQGMIAMRNRLGARLPAKAPRPFVEVMQGVMMRQVAYIRSIPLWPLRFCYWFFVRQHVRHGVPVSKQLQRKAGR